MFVGGFSLDGAAAVAADLDLDVVDGIESLLNNSLLRTERMSEGDPRFGMLETMREYALERLAERGDGEAVRRRHAGFYLRLAEDAEPALLGPEQMRWARKLDSERDNLRAALTWAAESGETEVGLRTAGALWRFWQMRAADVEGREHLDRLLTVGFGLAVDPRHGANHGLPPSPTTRATSTPCIATSRRASRSTASWATTSTSRSASWFSP